MIKFRRIHLSADKGSEEARLVLLNDLLVAILVRLKSDDVPADRQGWYLETGFPPCRAEGVVFPTLDAVAEWLQARLPDGPARGRAEAA